MVKHISFQAATGSSSQPVLLNPKHDVGAPRIAVWEQNQTLLRYLDRALGHRYQLLLCKEPDGFLAGLGASYAACLIDWDHASRSLEVLTQVRAQHPKLPVVMLSCSSDPSDHETFTRLGVSTVLMKPFTADALQTVLKSCLPSALLADEPDTKEIVLDPGHSFVRANPRMREIERQATLVARSDIPVLILGESGTGKEVIALLTHKMSRRRERMFLKINCAAMPAELLESELFGYEQGAFTGAIKTKPGKFEICDGGTIFLDEIGEMPAILQAKLLQVLQDGTFSRLGARSSMKTDVRIIAATNINIKQAMANKTFREDLYYRLNGVSLILPPLRERLDELPALTKHFLRKGAQKYGFEELHLSPFLLSSLLRYRWPGNLRELENTMNRLLVLRDEHAILAELHLEPAPSVAAMAPGSPSAPVGDEFQHDLKRMVRGVKGEAESAVIKTVLERSGWNRKAAAQDLQISYKALLYKIKQYELAPKSA